MSIIFGSFHFEDSFIRFSNFKKTNNFMVQFSLDDKDKENEDEFNLKSLARVYKEAYDELFL